MFENGRSGVGNGLDSQPIMLILNGRLRVSIAVQSGPRFQQRVSL